MWILMIVVIIFFVIIILKSSKESAYVAQRRAEAEEYFAKQRIDEAERKANFNKMISELDEKYAGFGIIECELAGLFYRTRAAKEEVREYLKPGHDFILKLDKKNQYDKYAVKVMYNGKHVGFIPMQYSKQVHDYMILNFGYIAICTSNIERYNDNFNDEENIVEIKLYPKTENN